MNNKYLHYKTILSYAFLVIILIWFIIQTLYPASQNLTHGFGAYYTAARLLKSGQLSADIYQPDYFRPLVEAASHHQSSDIYNANPPTTTLMFWPLTFFSIETARAIWIGVNGLLLCSGIAVLIWTFADSFHPTLYALLLTLAMLFQPVRVNIKLGQVYLLIFWLLSITVVAWQKRWPQLGGIALASALLLKTAGWIILPLLAWQRRWLYLAWTLGLVGGSLLLTLPFFPLTMWQSYITLLQETTQAPLTCLTAYQTTRSLLCHLLVFDPLWNKTPLIHSPHLASILFNGLALLTLILNFFLNRYNQSVALMGMISWSILFAPLGEQYHHTIMLIPIAWLIILWHKGNFNHKLGKFCLIIALLAYCYPFMIGSSQFQQGWYAMLAYPRVYSAWLVLLALYSILLQDFQPWLRQRRLEQPLDEFTGH